MNESSLIEFLVVTIEKSRGQVCKTSENFRHETLKLLTHFTSYSDDDSLISKTLCHDKK